MDSVFAQSRELSFFLDSIGLSEKEIEWRQRMWQLWEFFMPITRIQPGIRSLHVTGRRAEGVGLHVFGSDIDCMVCLENFRVIHSLSELDWNSEKLTLLADTSQTHPGYCHLRVLNQREPITITCAFSENGSQNFFNGDLVFCHFPYFYFQGAYQQGPAETFGIPKHSSLCKFPTQCVVAADLDRVRCLETSWPNVALGWIHRSRRNKFPSPDFINSAQSRGAFVVQTAHRSSRIPHVEWRYSFSLLELEIMRMWPNTALKCYAVLKLLKKTIINQSQDLRQTLNTYHLKTLLFWMVEEKGLQFWVEVPLLECLKQSLMRLVEMLREGCISHYFVKTNNLFDQTAGTAKQSFLVEIFTGILSDDFLGDVYYKLYYQISVACSTQLSEQQIGSLPTETERLDRLLHLGYAVDSSLGIMMKNVFSNNFQGILAKSRSLISDLRRVNVEDDNDISLFISYIDDVLRSICGIRILTFVTTNRLENKTCAFLCRISKEMLVKSMPHVAVQLRLVLFYFSTGNYRSALEEIQKALETDSGLRIKSDFFGGYRATVDQVFNLVSVDSVFQAISNLTTTSIIFLKDEGPVLPTPLVYDIFSLKASTSNMETYLRQEHTGSGTLVDPDVILHYMRYLCCRQLGRKTRADEALRGLKSVVNNDQVLCKDMALNILGHSYFTHGNLRLATDCFVKAFCAQPTSSTSLIHLAMTLKKAFNCETAHSVTDNALK